MRSSVIVYQRQRHVCVHFILWFQWNEQDWSARLCASHNHWQQHSTWFQKQHISASERLLFNTNERNEYSATQLEMFHLLQAYLYRKMFQKRTFRWRRSRIYGGISDLTAYTAGVNARIRFIPDYFHIWMRPETDRRISESMWLISAYTVVGHIRSVPHGRIKSELGHLNYAV